MTSQSYFAEQAAKYDDRFSKGILGKVRNAEKKAVLGALAPKKGETILDIPCGSGYYASFIREAGADVYGIDLSPEMVAVFKSKGFDGEIGNLEEFSLGRKFDKVLSAGGFEFCNNHNKILHNLLAHTNSGGSITILMPRKSFFGYLYQLYHKLCHKEYIVLFSKKDFLSLCAQNDITDVQLRNCSLFALVVRIELTK